MLPEIAAILKKMKFASKYDSLYNYFYGCSITHKRFGNTGIEMYQEKTLLKISKLSLLYLWIACDSVLDYLSTISQNIFKATKYWYAKKFAFSIFYYEDIPFPPPIQANT